MSASPETAARARKATRLAATATRMGVSATELANSADIRAKVTTVTQTTPPSAETWQLALALMEATTEAWQPAKWLRERADSYSRDAKVFRDDGDTAMAALYQAIADELRTVANEVRK